MKIYIVAGIFLVISSVFALDKMGYVDVYKILGIKNVSQDNQALEVVVQPICNSEQYLEDGVCKNITHTCPDGRVIPGMENCDIEVATTTATSSNEIVATTSEVSSPRIRPTPTTSEVIDETLPRIKNVTVTTNAKKNMVIAILGVNFDNTTNIVTLTTGTGIVKNLTLPSYPSYTGGSKNNRVINFEMTDFRTFSKGDYSFKVTVNGKTTDSFIVKE